MKQPGLGHCLRMFLVLAAATLLTTGCSDSSSDSISTPKVTLEGSVVDGYVRGATVDVYDVDTGFSASDVKVIATAKTDENGDFVITLPEEDLPEYMAFLSRGGTIIDTGLPAPTMILMPTRDQDRYTVTPLTDFVVRGGMRADSSFVEAENFLADKLGLAPASLYDDPLEEGAPAELKNGLYQCLAGGDHTVTLANGSYKLALLYLDRNFLGYDYTGMESVLGNLLEGTITINGGAVSGTLGGEPIDGRIQGPNMVLSIPYENGVTNIAGAVGLLGSFSGNYLDFDASAGEEPALSAGVFVASLIPGNGIDQDAFITEARKLYNGSRNALFRDLYDDQDLGWGVMDSVGIQTDKTITASSFQIHLNDAEGEPDTLVFDAGKLLVGGDGELTGLAVLRFKEVNDLLDETDYAYLIQALGNRRGIYVAGDSTIGMAYAIGESYLARSDALGGHLTQDQPYDLYVSTVSPDWLRYSRPDDSVYEGNWIQKVDNWHTPVFDETGISAEGDSSTGDVKVVSGSLLGMKNSSAGTSIYDIDSPDDFLAVAEMHATGAIQGDIATGGYANWSVPLVGYARPAGDSFDYSLDYGEMQLDFLARPLYVTDKSGTITLENYKLAWITGTVEFHDETVILNYRDSGGETGTLNLSVEFEGGIYHIKGQMGETEWLDMLWPGGGTRAVFVSSYWDEALNNYIVYEIGEAYITF